MTGNQIVSILEKQLPNLVESKKQELIEFVDNLLNVEPYEIDRERFNIILTFWPFPPCNSEFFSYYFGNRIKNITELEKGLERFVKHSLWHFGDIRRAYFELRVHNDISRFIKEHSYDVEAFKNRLPWNALKKIEPQDRGYLGYVSGERPKREQAILEDAEKIIFEIEENSDEYETKSPEEVATLIIDKLSISDEKFQTIKSRIEEIESLKEIDLFASSDLEKNKKIVSDLKEQAISLIQKVEDLKEIGLHNQNSYLKNIENIDVYVATSMRDDKEYAEMFEFVSKTFTDSHLKNLNLRYFDPTLCYCDSRIDKGIIECLLVRTAKVTIYCAQEGDTFGKDSELAATLCQGKPAIIYVPKSDDPVLGEKLDKRAKVFKEFHPLGLQVGVYDGVARGIIVVRTPEQCARILYKILTNDIDVEIVHEQHGIVLREIETKSVVRVMTGWRELSSLFWNNFDKSYNPKSGRPD